MSDKLSIRNLHINQKKVLIRVDFNVPFEDGKITDDSRIHAALPTIQYALAQGARVILMSHLGRPKGKVDPQFSLQPCAQHLSKLLNKPVLLAPDCVGSEVEKMVLQLQPGEILLLENLRFHKGEEKPQEDPDFVKKLAKLGDVYVNDAFGTAHRAHASTALITQFFPDQSASGFLLEKEIDYLSTTLLNPKHPFCAILGGSKISTKFKIIEVLLQKADLLLIGGAMAYTFFKAEGIAVGDSLFEKDFVDMAQRFINQSQQSHCRLLLPIDLVIASQIKSDAETRIINIKQGIPDGFQGVDIGPQTIQLYNQEMKKAATVFWNGPLGVFECPPFDRGTNEIAQTLASLKSAISIVGGGDSVAAIEKTGIADQITHISTGGGATLEYIQLGRLPGIDALTNCLDFNKNKNK